MSNKSKSYKENSPRVYIKTFGCQMNFRDSEVMAGLLQKEGFEIVDNPNLADVALVNTCSVRQHAEDRAYGLIWELKKFKKENPSLLIGVCGCMAEKDKENIFLRAPHVNIIVGPHSFYQLPQIIKSLDGKQGRIVAVDNGEEPFISESLAFRANSYQAWISIIRGCNNFCSFCIVPYVRGRERSRPQEEILDTIEALTQNGVKEVTLLGQNVLAYGKDLENADFVDLLEKINNISGVERLRFITAHPRDVNSRLIEAIAHLSKVCEHIHLPVQSGSDKILKMMNRGYSRDFYFKTIEQIRKIIPEVSITSDIMVGFPSETEEDFRLSKELMKEVEFDNTFIFKYSTRERTATAKLKDNVSVITKEGRLAKLLELQEKITFKKNKELKGKKVEVLAEKLSEDKKRVVGKTRTNKIVIFTPLEIRTMGTAVVYDDLSLTGFTPKSKKDILGKVVNVHITKTGSWRLLGRQID